MESNRMWFFWSILILLAQPPTIAICPPPINNEASLGGLQKSQMTKNEKGCGSA